MVKNEYVFFDAEGKVALALAPSDEIAREAIIMVSQPVFGAIRGEVTREVWFARTGRTVDDDNEIFVPNCLSATRIAPNQ